MAVISNTETIFGKMRVMKIVKFSTKDGKFKIQVPPGARGICGEYVSGDTLKEVNKAYETASAMYLDASVKDEKVIVIAFQGTCRIEENGEIVFECDKGYSVSGGIELELECEVFIKRTWTCPDCDTVENYIETEHSISEIANFSWTPGVGGTGHVEVPWNKESEQFFAELVDATQQIIRKLSEFTTNAKSVLKFADRGLKFLPSAENKTKQKRRKL